jgi:predicted membrane channel-forming protein YqfA (hemolysin III family)
MAMKETVRSLRAYFLLSGIASLCFGFLGLAASLPTVISPTTLLVASIGIVGIGFSLAFLYVGAFLPGLLRNSSHRIVILLYASTAWAVLTFLLSLLNGVQPGAIVVIVISLLILWYLLRNVRRLAGEAHQSVPTA